MSMNAPQKRGWPVDGTLGRPPQPSRKEAFDAREEERKAKIAHFTKLEAQALEAYSQALELWAAHGCPDNGKYANLRRNAFLNWQRIYDAYLKVAQ